MNKERLKEVILEQSTRTSLTDYVPRLAYEEIEPLKKNKEIIIITGMRRCGKSTLLQKIRDAATEKNYYLNFEDDRLINFALEDFQLLLEVFIELYGGQHTFYFDEIQNVPQWESFIRRLYEDGNKIYITGSNATMLSKELGTKLTGRYIFLRVYPYSFYEFTRYYAPELIDKTTYTTIEKGKANQLFENYCLVGGIPEYVKYQQENYLHDLYEGIIYRDIITRYKLTNERPIKELAFYLASNISKDITFNALRKIINVSNARTTAEYCTYLENCYLCFLIERYSHSVKKQFSYGKKQYFIDPALAYTIGFRTSKDKGRLLENIVFLELKRRYRDVYFHKDKRECDFIVRNQNQVINAIQVCSSLDSEEAKTREYAGLIEAMRTYQLKGGLILTSDTENTDTIHHENNTYKILIMPIWKWLLIKSI